MIMGLDMYLIGEKITSTRDIVDGYKVISVSLDLGQWRKHWALHKYIMDMIHPMDGAKIELDAEEMRRIADAVEQGKLPDAKEWAHYSDEDRITFHKKPNQVAKTLKILRDAADWLDKEDNAWKSVEYYGSW
jgi:hypothetical protein